MFRLEKNGQTWLTVHRIEKKENNYQVEEEEADGAGGGGDDDAICSLFKGPEEIWAVAVEELSWAAVRIWYCWRKRLTVIAFVGFDMVVGDWARWFIFDDMMFKCCSKFCRVILDEFVADCSSPPVVVVDGNWKTILGWDVFVVKLSVVGSRIDDDFSFDVEPTDDADDVDAPGIVLAGTSTARGVCVVSFGSVLVTLNDLIRCTWAARSGEISWSMLMVDRGNDAVAEFARL